MRDDNVLKYRKTVLKHRSERGDPASRNFALVLVLGRQSGDGHNFARVI